MSYFESSYKEHISTKYPSFTDKNKAGIIYDIYKLVTNNEDIMRNLDKIAEKMDSNKDSVFEYSIFRIEADSIAKSVAPLSETLTKVDDDDPSVIVSDVISFYNASNWKNVIPKLDIIDKKVISKIPFVMDLFL